MDKIRQQLSQKVALQQGRSSELIEKILAFEWQDAKEAVHVHREVEISGLGKFVLSTVRVKTKIREVEKMIEKMEAIQLSKPSPEYAQRIEDTKQALNFLRHHEFQGDIRRMEKSSGSSRTSKGSNRENIQGENGDLQGVPL